MWLQWPLESHILFKFPRFWKKFSKSKEVQSNASAGILPLFPFLFSFILQFMIYIKELISRNYAVCHSGLSGIRFLDGSWTGQDDRMIKNMRPYLCPELFRRASVISKRSVLQEVVSNIFYVDIIRNGKLK